MRQKLLIITILVFMSVVTGGIQAQSSLIFKMSDGTQLEKDLSSVKKITFSGGNLLLNISGGDNTIVSLPAIVSMVFNRTPSNIESSLEDRESLAVYPNPATDILYIKNAPAKESEVLVFTADGRMVLRSHVFSSEQPVDVSSLSPGFYLLKINSWVFKFRKL